MMFGRFILSDYFITSHGRKIFPRGKPPTQIALIATATCKLPDVLLSSSRVPAVAKFIKYSNRRTVGWESIKGCVMWGVWWCVFVWSALGGEIFCLLTMTKADTSFGLQVNTSGENKSLYLKLTVTWNMSQTQRNTYAAITIRNMLC